MWHRWDPHVHAPGTLLNDQFRGHDAWERYLTHLEASDPPIRALGITDYYLTDAYERVRLEKDAGRLPSVDLIFPNVELRLAVGTLRGRAVNVHLLVSPEDPDHLKLLHEFLTSITFWAHEEVFPCTRDGLIRLGKTSGATVSSEKEALGRGASQFKVAFNDLREALKKSSWARSNILIAAASSEKDGTSGVREPADQTLREEIEAFADVIFASGTAQREYWLGEHPSMTADDIRQRYGSLKPCLHGSDAHRFSQVGEPDDDRYCWIKGELSFDTLRQACIDPASRAFVGPAPPKSTAPSQILDRLRVSDASWATTPELVLNPGLVAVIGARGSGKTALAEIVARACDAIPAPPDPELPRRPSSSFLERAGDLLGDASVTLTWEAGETSSRRLDGSDTQDRTFPRARYLSQDFVDSLCSSTTLTDELLREIERVIFEAHPILARDGALNFAELLEMRASRHRLARSREEQSILTLSDRIASEFNKRRLIDTLKDRVARTRRLIAAYTADRKRLVSRGSQHRVSRLTEVAAATEKVRAYVRYLRAQERALLALRDEVMDVRTNKAPEQLRRTRERHSETQITPDDWEPFKLDYAGDVDEQIRKYLHQCRGAIRVWRGTTPRTQAQPDGSFVLKDAVLEKLPLATLEAELKRLEKLVDADRRTQEQFAQLSGKIRHETTTLGVLQEKLKDATGAGERIQELQTEREEAYKRVFDAIVKEQQVLADLYAPLVERMSATSETLKKITFTVTRTAAVDKWAESAETHLVDLRRQGPFRGRGQLRDCARTILRKPWETGDAHAVCAAMAEFRKEYQEVLLEHAVVSKTDPVQHREWLKRFATWLFSTEHISLNYRLDFGGVDIRKLSPGNRGIVLLLLYLALDYADDRPLIIDQPEENLDPKSVQDELVGLFVEAKLKRQVIMVTHNANLVVNADADQIIIAEARSQQRGALPEITYTAGGLENCAIRRAVCDILEGGEEAFRERARRLRVGLVR